MTAAKTLNSLYLAAFLPIFGEYGTLGGVLNEFSRRAGSAVVQGKAREAWFGRSK